MNTIAVIAATSFARLYPAAQEGVEPLRVLPERKMARLVDDMEQRAALVPRKHLVQLDAAVDHRRAVVESPDHLHRALQATLIEPLERFTLLTRELRQKELRAELLADHLAHALLVLRQRERRHDRVDPFVGHDVRVVAVALVDPAHAFARARRV